MRYACVDYPSLRVLIERRPKEAQDHFAQFERGTYETDDPREIEVLDVTERVYRADEINLDAVRVVVNTDEGEKEVDLKMKKRGKK